METMGLYVHIPFCASKCFYCDFLSFPQKNAQEAYVQALIEELKSVSQSMPKHQKISSIFIGGGTPTVLPPLLIDQILAAIMRYFNLTENCEWTIEANPGTLTVEKLKVLNAYPVTRISLGLQSTHNSLLKKIGRGHLFEDWQESMQLLTTHTNLQINADLMFALPGQSFEMFRETLECVTQYPLDHLSLYALIVEEGTPFWKLYETGKLARASDELDRQMYHYAQQYLKTKGYKQYEISNWAKPGKVCQHNKVYWELKPYIGVGLGAHSYVAGKRFYNTEKLEKYLEAQGDLTKLRHVEELLTKSMMMEEYMFLGLRLIDGISIEAFKKRFGVDVFEVYPKVLQRWLSLDILKKSEGRLFLSSYGLDVCNEVFASFLA